MPNWCYNRFRVTGSAEDVARFQKQAVGFYPWCKPEPEQAEDVLNFHGLVPIPPEVLAAGYQPGGKAWERRHWGCNFGACRAAVTEQWQGGVLYEFDTAWSPSVRFVESVSRAWPTLLFVLDYEEPILGFKGLARAKAGALDDHCIKLY